MRVLTYETKRKTAGLLFVLPWIIGTLVFFIQPVITSIYYSLSNVSLKTEGGLNIERIKGALFQNFSDAFLKDPEFVWYFKDSVTAMFYTVPLIIIFSLFIANLLTKKFAGRVFMRVIFFLPVIITSGIVIEILQQGLMVVGNNGQMDGANIFNNQMLSELLVNSGLPRTLVEYLTGVVNNIIDLVWKSGVQILVFMSGILSIPRSFYEVAEVEGAAPWETFWKITFPMIIPHILINITYSVVDSLSSYDNKIMRYIIDTIYRKILFSYGSALSWIYFIVVLAFIGLIFFVINRFAHTDTK
jgi:ABC-type sugar transport system permease subunit